VHFINFSSWIPIYDYRIYKRIPSHRPKTPLFTHFFPKLLISKIIFSPTLLYPPYIPVFPRELNIRNILLYIRNNPLIYNNRLMKSSPPLFFLLSLSRPNNYYKPSSSRNISTILLLYNILFPSLPLLLSYNLIF
jgi:hypothetical protein